MQDLSQTIILKDNLEKKLAQVEGKEILNQFNIMNKSKLMITISSTFDIQTNNPILIQKV
jgi:hypothetical protein